MNGERAAYWQAYIEQIAALLDRRDWRIMLSQECAAGDADADCWIQDDHHFARIRLKSDWEDDPPEEQRYTITHEVMHLHFQQASEAAYRAERFMSEREFRLFSDAYESAFELGVDSVAYAVARLLPLPSHPLPLPPSPATTP